MIYMVLSGEGRGVSLQLHWNTRMLQCYERILCVATHGARTLKPPYVHIVNCSLSEHS